jgi:prepilin-type N-terminal cleavage/methylation domain-containing protein
MKKEQGFSLIELLIVVAIIAIIAAIAVPSMLTARMAANESGAVQSLRTFGSAEVAYAAVTNQQFGTIADLVTGGYLDQRWSDAEFNGYDFVEGADITGAPDGASGAAPGAFGTTATPSTPGSTGRYSYGIAADQVVRYTADTTPPTGIAAGDPIGKVAAAQ